MKPRYRRLNRKLGTKLTLDLNREEKQDVAVISAFNEAREPAQAVGMKFNGEHRGRQGGAKSGWVKQMLHNWSCGLHRDRESRCLIQ
jgi:hypothetical protein